MFFAFASLVAAVVPMFTYLVLIWWLDRNDREPFWLVFLNFFWGSTGAIFLGIIGSLIFQVPLNVVIQEFAGKGSYELMDLSGAVITAPFVEEFTKGIFLLMMSYNKRFDGVVDGVVYGGAIGLGFGMTENFLYFVTYGSTPGDWLYLVIIRTLFSAVLHCLAQATFGAFIGYAKFKSLPMKFLLIPIGYLAAVFLHFTWNLTVSFEDTSLLGFAFLIMYFIAFFVVFQFAIYFEGKTIKKELHEESQHGIIPAEHLNYLPYVTRRSKYGWVPQGVNQRDYVKTAITLAIRKDQYKSLTGVKKSDYEKEIALLRYNIQMMFYNATVNYNYQNRQV
jgi:RsiW-degrading membrane proteinase PrsW (M82 family)